MSSQSQDPADAADLRRRAEERLKLRELSPKSDTDTHRLLHELQVHQIELEMQNQELEQARIELETALDRYTELYDFAPAGYLTLLPDGTIRQANLAAARLLGTERAHLLNRRFALFVAVDARCAFAGFLDQAFASKVPEVCEVGLSIAGQTPLTVQLRACAAGDGQQCGVILIDLTGLKRTEEALRVSEESFRAIANYTVDWENWFDPDGTLRWVNPAVEQMTGYSVAECLAMPAFPLPLFAEEDRAMMSALFRGAGHGTSGHNREFRVICKDGTKRWVAVSWQPIFSSDGTALGHRSSIRDIARSKQAEKTLRESEHFTKQVLDCLTANIAVLDTQGVIVAVNESWRRFARENRGGDPAAYLGANYLTVCEASLRRDDDGTVTAALRGLRAVIAGRQDRFSLEYPCHSPDERRWFSVHVTRFPGEGAVRVVAAHENITERKLAEKRLRESEERYRVLVEDQTEVICRFRADGTFTFVNDVYCRFFGKSAQALLGQSWQPQVVPDDLPLVTGKLQTLDPSNPVVVIENRVTSASGQTHWMQFVNRGFFDPQGRLVDVQAVGRDITERRRAEEALRESEAGLAAAQRIAHIGFWQWHIQANTAHWSDETFRIFGIAPSLLDEHRQSFVDMVHPADRERVNQALTDAVSGAKDYDLDYRLLMPDGTEKVIHAQAEVVRSREGQPVILQGTVHDITERKRADDELRASREQMRALAARLQAAREEERTLVAREIHDVLAQELTRLKIDLVRLHGRLTKTAKLTPAKILAEHVAAMTQMADTAIRSVQEIATGLRPAVLDSLGLCAAVEWQVRDFRDRAGIQCHVYVPEEDLAVDRDSATAAFRILQESLTNVLRHAEATRVDVSLRQEAGELVLSVRDNGCGIRAETSNNPRSIGLAGMRERALLLGGQLEIRSQPGPGTTIEMRIPLPKSESPPGQRA